MRAVERAEDIGVQISKFGVWRREFPHHPHGLVKPKMYVVAVPSYCKVHNAIAEGIV